MLSAVDLDENANGIRQLSAQWAMNDSDDSPESTSVPWEVVKQCYEEASKMAAEKLQSSKAFSDCCCSHCPSWTLIQQPCGVMQPHHILPVACVGKMDSFQAASIFVFYHL